MYSTTQNPPLMGRNLYKSTLDFLTRYSNIENRASHHARLRTLAGMISSLAHTGRCSLEGLSRRTGSDCRQAESRIAQAKRWLKGKWVDWDTFFAPYIVPLLERLSRSGELVLVVDGTSTGQGCSTLMLSVVWKKYAIPIVWMTRQAPKGHFADSQHLDLLKQCEGILPTQGKYRVVLLGDGEFDGNGLRDFCWDKGWEFVLRTSVDKKIDCGVETARIDSLLPMLENQSLVFVENGCGRDNAILWRAKGQKDPIPLLTNMDLGPMACRYYRLRFKIETMFKQMKSDGFHLNKSMLQHADRVANFLIVVALAFILVFCVGQLLRECEKAVVAPIFRPDRATVMGPMTLAKKAFADESDLAYYLFFMLTKNFEVFFTPDQ